jgi:CheY-like chemotaxis protein
MERRRRPVTVLLVEDNPGDVRLTQEAFRECAGTIDLHVVTDGVEAMQFLRRTGRHSDVALPDMILLDLNLPGKDGREVLAEIKDDPELHQIPVTILTTSAAEQDILKTYDLHANCYLTKPIDLDEFMRLVTSLGDFWTSCVTLPVIHDQTTKPDVGQE